MCVNQETQTDRFAPEPEPEIEITVPKEMGKTRSNLKDRSLKSEGKKSVVFEEIIPITAPIERGADQLDSPERKPVAFEEATPVVIKPIDKPEDKITKKRRARARLTLTIPTNFDENGYEIKEVKEVKTESPLKDKVEQVVTPFEPEPVVEE